MREKVKKMEIVSFINDLVFAASGNSIATGIRNFIGPILMLIMGCVSIVFLFQRQMTQFVIFLVIAVVVAIIFYAPGIITNLGKSVNDSSGVKGSWK